jgi:hypothetical protein
MQFSRLVGVFPEAIRSGLMIGLAQRRRWQSKQAAVRREILEFSVVAQSMVSLGFPFLCPAKLIVATAASARGEGTSGENVLHLIQSCLATLSLIKITPGSKIIRARIADSSSKSAVSFSSARRT